MSSGIMAQTLPNSTDTIYTITRDIEVDSIESIEYLERVGFLGDSPEFRLFDKDKQLILILEPNVSFMYSQTHYCTAESYGLIRFFEIEFLKDFIIVTPLYPKDKSIPIIYQILHNE